MSDRNQSAAHPRTGQSTGVMKDGADGSESRRSRRASRMEAQEAAAPLQPGVVVAGRYKIERLLGVGGMGAVYEATQVAISRRVALKVVRADYADDASMVARFQREARAASAVQHPNVVMVHDFGQGDDGTLFMVMELLSGESLLQRMRREIATWVASYTAPMPPTPRRRSILYRPATTTPGWSGAAASCASMRDARRERRLSEPSAPSFITPVD